MKVKFLELMAESGDQEMKDYDEDEDDGEFYTPGPTSLYDIRKSIAEYSLSLARTRIAKQRQLFNEVNTRNIDLETGDPLTGDRFTQILQTRRNFNDKYLKNLKLQGSQIVSGRFTSMVGISPHVSDEEGVKERIIACGSWDGKTYLMDSQLNNFAVLKGHTDKVSGLDWNPQKPNNLEQQQVATGGGEGSINIYNIPSSPSNFPQPKTENGTTVITPTHKLQHSSQPAAPTRTARIKYHQSGKFLASAHYDNTWKLWDLTKLVPSSSLLYEQEGHYTNPPFTLSWHPDGALLATGGLDGIIKIWDLRSGMNVLNFGGVLPTSGSHVDSSSLSSTSTTADKPTTTSTSTAYAHAKAIHSVKFRNNGYELISGSADSLIKVWDLRSAKPPPPPTLKQQHHSNSYSNWEMATGWGTRGSVGSTSAGFKTDVGLHTGAVTDLVLGYGGNGDDDSFFVSCGYDGVLNVVDCDSWRLLKKFDVGTKIMSCDVCFDEDGEGVKIVCGGWDRGVKLFTL
ncbi:unnamed protein product [Ambrosiozyma monospora]|uniref:Unnamed protein product n=1 Tax=Ambrosiozyma monospora TaxID=43982 RepID=A0ACB5TKS5_AMBMO|nr:unnamed protein product [Ambrosiozyma monospora]